MNTKDFHPAATDLRKGKIHRLHNALGQRIESLRGHLWITIDNDIRDIVLAAGEGFDIDRNGGTLISAIDDSRFLVLDPVRLGSALQQRS